MSELQVETISRKAELAYLHWTIPVALVCLNAFLVWKHFPALTRVVSSTPASVWLLSAIYVLIVGAIASIFGFLSHDMFHWNILQRAPYAITLLLISGPPVAQILLRARKANTQDGDIAKSGPVLLSAMYLAISVVFCMSPLTAIE